MKSLLLGVSSAVLVTLSAPAFADVVQINSGNVTYVGGAAAVTVPGNLTVVEDFEDPASGTFTAGSGTRSATGSDAARPAFGSVGNFATILPAPNTSTGTYSLTFDQPVQVLSFILGSLDTYNFIDFVFANDNTTTLSGGQIVAGSLASTAVNPSGSQTQDATNGRVTYDFGGMSDYGAGLKTIIFRSEGVAFEIDGIATAAPEPGTWGMMIVGFGLAGGALRMRRRTKGLVAA